MLPLAAKTAARGHDVILGMLVVGLIFLGVIAARRATLTRRQAAQARRRSAPHDATRPA